MGVRARKGTPAGVVWETARVASSTAPAARTAKATSAAPAARGATATVSRRVKALLNHARKARSTLRLGRTALAIVASAPMDISAPSARYSLLLAVRDTIVRLLLPQIARVLGWTRARSRALLAPPGPLEMLVRRQRRQLARNVRQENTVRLKASSNAPPARPARLRLLKGASNADLVLRGIIVSRRPYCLTHAQKILTAAKSVLGNRRHVCHVLGTDPVPGGLHQTISAI
jgi:hypothetical protein